MAKKRRVRLSEEEIRKLEQEKEELGRYIDECLARIKEIKQGALEAVGHQPIIRNPEFRNYEEYDQFVDVKTGKVKDWFWTDKPTDTFVVRMGKHALRSRFLFYAIMTKEEQQEYDRLLEEMDNASVRKSEIEYLLEGLPPEEAKRQALADWDLLDEDEDEHGFEGVIFTSAEGIEDEETDEDETKKKKAPKRKARKRKPREDS